MRENRSSGRDAAVLVAGIAAGILGSRLLPPIIAMASGVVRGGKGQDAFDILITDHRTIQSLLDQMVATPTESNAKRTSLFLLLKRKLGKHAMAEEDVVYPLLHEEAADQGRSKHLYDEHADMKILLYDLEERLMSRTDWNEPVQRLRTLINEHIEEEEQVVFPRLRSVSSGKLSKISGQIRREEALIL
jgi:hemerythrin superfamily protein